MQQVAGVALAGLFCLVLTVPARAQMGDLQLPPGQQNGGSMKFGPGVTTIGDTTFVSFTIEPELVFGKIGLGLSIPLLYNTDTHRIRKSDWDTSQDYARLLRYIRWGMKRDPLFARIGELTNTTFGHGFVVYYYNNAIDDDYPKRGLQFDMDFGEFGFESLIGNLGRQELYGGRGYVRPLRMAGSEMPVVKNITVGATLITDRDSRLPQPLTVYGLDLEQPLIHNDLADLYLYLDWSNIGDWDTASFGHGFAYGVATDLRGIAGLFQIGAKFEMRNLSEGFSAGLVSPLWDVQKPEILAALPSVPATNGWYGEIVGSVLGRVSVRGSYFNTGLEAGGDQFVLNVDANRALPTIALEGYYVKQGIRTGADVWKLDENALTVADVGYRPYPFMSVVMRYEWSYVPDGAGGYRTQKRVEPRMEFGFSW